jgi:hypothetical protein
MQGGEKTIEGFCPAGYEGRSERKRGREGCRVPAGALFHFLFGFEAKLPLERCLRRKEIANEKGADSSPRNGSAGDISSVDGKRRPDLVPLTFPE